MMMNESSVHRITFFNKKTRHKTLRNDISICKHQNTPYTLGNTKNTIGDD